MIKLLTGMLETMTLGQFCHNEITNGMLETTTISLFCHYEITDVSSKQRHVMIA